MISRGLFVLLVLVSIEGRRQSEVENFIEIIVSLPTPVTQPGMCTAETISFRPGTRWPLSLGSHGMLRRLLFRATPEMGGLIQPAPIPITLVLLPLLYFSRGARRKFK